MHESGELQEWVDHLATTELTFGMVIHLTWTVTAAHTPHGCCTSVMLLLCGCPCLNTITGADLLHPTYPIRLLLASDIRSSSACKLCVCHRPSDVSHQCRLNVARLPFRDGCAGTGGWCWAGAAGPGAAGDALAPQDRVSAGLQGAPP